MPTKPTLAIGHPLLGRGGSEFKVLWGIQSLRDDYDITVVTSGGFDLDGLNALCGTSVRSRDFSLMQVSLPAFLGGRAAALRGSIFVRQFRRLAPRFDLLVSAYNPCDLGRRALQCVADFSWHEALRRQFHPAPPGAARLFHRSHCLRSLYLRLCRCIYNNDIASVLRRDLLIANSNWTAGHLKALGAREVMVLYPPVSPGLRALPWNERKQGFVALGRIAPEKRIEAMIEIVEGLRKRRHPVFLCIVGRLNGDAYSDQVRKLAAERQEWVTLAGPAYGDEKPTVLGSHRFGLHAAFGEAFGIGVAEMANAGCIPFVRDGAGPAEIVAQPELTFSVIPEAVAKIDRVLREPGLQHDLRSRLALQVRRYSAEEFSRQFRSIVEEFRKAVPSPARERQTART